MRMMIAIALASVCVACAAAPSASDVAVRPGAWRSVAIDAHERPDPDSADESCRGETTWFALAALSSGSREMGCEPLRPVRQGGRIAAARETCRQGARTVIRLIRVVPRSPPRLPLAAFDEITELRVAGHAGREVSRTRHDWQGSCPGPHGTLIGG